MYFSENSNDWTGFGVISENGELLGWVRNTILSSEDNSPMYLIISILSQLWLPKVATGSYKLSTSEIVSFGADRLIVFEGAEARIVCQKVSWLERIGLVQPPWCQENSDDSGEDDEGSTGNSLVPNPRKPSPSSLSAEEKAPQN